MMKMADDWKYRTKAMRAYLCDGMKPCASSPFCELHSKSVKKGEGCSHTKDIYHAMNYNNQDKMQFEVLETGDEWEIVKD